MKYCCIAAHSTNSAWNHGTIRHCCLLSGISRLPRSWQTSASAHFHLGASGKANLTRFPQGWYLGNGSDTIAGARQNHSTRRLTHAGFIIPEIVNVRLAHHTLDDANALAGASPCKLAAFNSFVRLAKCFLSRPDKALRRVSQKQGYLCTLKRDGCRVMRCDPAIGHSVIYLPHYVRIRIPHSLVGKRNDDCCLERPRSQN